MDFFSQRLRIIKQTHCTADGGCVSPWTLGGFRSVGAGLEELGKLCRGLVGPPVLFTEELTTQPSGGDWMIMVTAAPL